VTLHRLCFPQAIRRRNLWRESCFHNLNGYALIFDTERWALEFIPHGVRVNTVSPGSILVDGNGWDRYRIANPDYFDDYVRHGFPMGRLGTAEEVADVIVFLASPRAHWINGRNIAVDGLEQPHAPLDRRPF